MPEPIAIVGVACRFPGGANDARAFWDLLERGVDAITEVPAERWNAARFQHPAADAPGRMVTRWGGFVGNADAMDAAFFGIAPREASRMDPQHRWLAEVAWEAIEDAGLPPERLGGTRTGVFIGISSSDYPMLHRRDLLEIDGYTNIGSALSIAANRLSFLFNLRGPSLAVDTACSSSLVALHLAARSLWSGECEHALVGGANALLTPDSSIGFSHAHMLSPRGRCRAFDADADGYVRAEGAGAVLLMPARTAARLGLQPRALLVATASNQDGRSSSLTVPNQAAQEEMIREALASAGADARDVVFVETHGTGTQVGDPIEARALAAVLGQGRARDERLLLGSVKTNLGHLESASGLAGLIKAVLALERGAIPPNLHFTTPNPHLPLDAVCVPTELTPLPRRAARTPLVAVNSFGFGGTNAHALLAPAPELAPEPAAADGACLFPLSARSPAALAEYAQAFARFVGSGGAPSLRGLCAAAALGKSHHPLRHALVADSLASLREQLLAVRDADASPAAARPRVAFVFSGQGPQWWAMGRELYGSEKIVRDVWERCDALCRKLGGPSLLDALLSTETDSPLSHTDIAQPALFALQAGLVEMWRAWGIEPDAVIGHSVGEAAAAWASGGFDLKGILRVILARSRWQEKQRGLGRMLVAGISADDAGEWERKFAGRVAVAAFNSPRQVTLSGDAVALEEIAAELERHGIFQRFLRTEYAFHSAQMDAIEHGLRHELAGVSGGSAKVPMISTVTGEPVRADAMDAEYWWRNVREPVRFAAGIERLLHDGCTVFVEIGPHPVMASAIAEIAQARKSPATLVASLRRGDDERTTMLRGLAALYRAGAAVRWEALYSRQARALRLPAYPWQRQRLWHEAAGTARELRRPPAHPLLGDRQPHPQPTWLAHLDARALPWLADHRLGGSVVFPGAGYLEMAAAAAREHLGESAVVLEDVRFHRMLVLPAEQPVPVCVRLDPGASTFEILAASPDAPDEWQAHAAGIFRAARLHIPPSADLAALGAALGEERDPRDLYREAAEIGQVFGPSFQGVKSFRLREDEALGEVACEGVEGYALFPPLLDSCFHPCGVLFRNATRGARAVVASVRRVQLFHPLPRKVWTHARVAARDAESLTADIAIHDAAGAVLARVDGLTVRVLDTGRAARERTFYRMEWQPADAPAADGAARAANGVLIFADAGGLGVSLAETLRARGIESTLAFRAGAQAAPHGALIADVAQADWAEHLWEGLVARGPLPEHVVNLWSFAEDAAGCGEMLALAQGRLAVGGDGAARWLVVTRQAQAVHDGERIEPRGATLWGFTRSMQTELPQWRASLVDCDGAATAEALARELFAAEIEPEVALRDGARMVRRLRTFEPATVSAKTHAPAFAIELGKVARPDALRFGGCARMAPAPDEIEVEVAAAGLNFRDLMKVLGIYPLRAGEPARLGDEFSGRVARVGRGVRELAPGDRVMGFAPAGGAFTSHLRVPAAAVWKVPAQLGFAEAATIPVAFGTAYHALHSLARLRTGETVLIHAAAGGVGLAAVQLALKIGAVVFATAGSEEKREYLRALGVARVMDSRTLDFADETLRETGGRGVDVVLNSLAGAFQQASLGVCAPHGRFIEIGKRDLFENRPLSLAVFQRSLTFSAFDLGAVMASRRAEWPDLRRFLEEEFAPGKLAPLPCTRFAAGDAVAAFRLMQGAQHIGKVVLEFDAAQAPEVPAEFWPDPDGTYLVTGGLSGLGLATARWLAGRGAMHLALLSLSGKSSAEEAPLVEELRECGVTVAAVAADVADAEALAGALRQIARTSPPLRGVFHSAMVIRDRMLATMTREDLDAVLTPKVAGAWNLHTQTRELPLDCFVMFSSIASLVGAQGQANYAAANAFLDALAHRRCSEGLPALTVNWGAIADTGVAARRPEIGRYLESIGVRGLASRDALATLSRLIASGEAQAGVMDVDWERLGRANPKYTESPVFRELASPRGAAAAADRAPAAWRNATLALPPEERLATVAELIESQLAATLGMKREEIDPARPLVQFGMDSLMAVELKTRIETQSGVELPNNLFSADLTARGFAERLLKHLGAAAVAASPAAEPAAPAEPPASEGNEAESSRSPKPAAPAASLGVRQSSTALADDDDPATHWARVPTDRARGFLHPLFATSVSNLRRCFREYGGPDAGFRLRALRLMCVCAARTPLRRIESWRMRRWVEPRPFTMPPIFIIGHWRSGTTYLHELLSRDPQSGIVTTGDAAMALDTPTFLNRAILAAMLPPQRPMDAVAVALDTPAEEEMAMASHGPLSFYHAFIFPRHGRRIYRESVHFDGIAADRVEAWWRDYVSFLKKVQFAQPGRRLVLKNPANTARVAALRARFPGAKFIHIHRHPEEVYASSLFLHRRLEEAWSLQDVELSRLPETVLANYADLMGAYFEQSRGMAADELIEVRLAELEAQPLATLEAIYRQLGLPGHEAAAPRFAAWLEAMGTFKKNRLSLDAGERDAVRKALADVFERWGYR